MDMNPSAYCLVRRLQPLAAAALFLAATSGPAAVLDGLVGYWSFDETNGTVLHDSTTNANHGTLRNAPRWTAGLIGGAFPVAEPPQRGPGLEGVDQRPGGTELIDVLGDEGVRQPSARTGRATFAAPLILVREAAQLREGDDFAELLVQRGERAKLLFEGREKLALQTVKDRRQIEHVFQTLQAATDSNPAQQKLRKTEF